MYVIIESYNKKKQVLWERNITLYYIKIKVDITTKSLDVIRYPLDDPFLQHTHFLQS
jgi:hypothetical protein